MTPQEVVARLQGMLAEIDSLDRDGVADLKPIHDLLVRVIEAGWSPDYRSALADALSDRVATHPALTESDLGRRLVAIQVDFERASFDRPDT